MSNPENTAGAEAISADELGDELEQLMKDVQGSLDDDEDAEEE